MIDEVVSAYVTTGQRARKVTYFIERVMHIIQNDFDSPKDVPEMVIPTRPHCKKPTEPTRQRKSFLIAFR